ncbi:hypothetical protein Tco_0621514, partial [Tanacetum coccineum]
FPNDLVDVVVVKIVREDNWLDLLLELESSASMSRRQRTLASSQSLRCPSVGSFIMSLEASDDLVIPDTKAIDPILEANSLPKFDMHLHKSSLTETHVKWLTKCYEILGDLRPRVVSEGMTMDALPNDAIRLYLVPLGVNRTTSFEMYWRSLDITPTVPLFRVFYKLCKQGYWFSFQNRVVDRRAAPIPMAWRHHDSSVTDPFPKPDEYNASHVAKLREVVIALRKPPPTFYMLQLLPGRVLTSSPIFQRCKVAAGALLPPDSARVTHLSTPAAALEDVTPPFLQYSSGS